MAALRIPVVTRSLSCGSWLSTERGNCVRSRIDEMIVKGFRREISSACSDSSLALSVVGKWWMSRLGCVVLSGSKCAEAMDA